MNDYILNKLVETKGPLAGAKIEKIDSVAGGCIHKTFRLKLKDGHNIFAKTTPADSLQMLRFEEQGLKALHKMTDRAFIEIPKPLTIEVISNTAILLMPWLTIGLGNQSSLGHGLALLHKSSISQSPGLFGWEFDGYIGSGPQSKGWEKGWGDCFVNLRLIPQIKIAAKWGLNFEDFEQMLSSLIPFLDRHMPSPSLVHGDLWSGNAGILNDGRGFLIDPATWWADREVDIAMTRLFGGFSKDFYNAYEKVWPLPKSYSERIDIYNLYHLLNHANIFGGSYKNQCQAILKRLHDLVI